MLASFRFGNFLRAIYYHLMYFLQISYPCIWKISNFINICFLPDYIITHSKMWLISKTKIICQTRPNNFESLCLFWKQQETNYKTRQKVSRKRRNENYSVIRNSFCNQNPCAKVMWNGSTQYQKPTSFRSSIVSFIWLWFW